MRSALKLKPASLILFAGVLYCGTEGSGHAATVRGQASCARGANPAATSYITVFRGDIGRSKPAQMGSDGKFYLYNVPSGKFALEVWSKQNPSAAPRVFEIVVAEPYTDIPQVSLPC